MKTYKSNSKTYNLVPVKTDVPKAKILSSRDINEYVRQFYGSDIEIVESFFIVLLNNQNNTIGWVKISQGGITGTLVDIRILAKYVLDALATAVILVHNHPSGTLRPSNADKDLTKKIKDGLGLLDVKVLDHLIVVPKDSNDQRDYFSFADEGIL
jgi:DNA repair protein RadC